MELTYQLNVNKIFTIVNGFICASESWRSLLFFHTMIIKRLKDPSQPATEGIDIAWWSAEILLLYCKLCSRKYV